MTQYHLVWYNKKEDLYSTGCNFKADSPEEAISQWRELHPNGVFFAIYLTGNN